MYSYVLHLSLDVAVDEDRVSDCHIVFGFHFPHFKNLGMKFGFSHQNDNSLKLTNTATDKPNFSKNMIFYLALKSPTPLE